MFTILVNKKEIKEANKKFISFLKKNSNKPKKVIIGFPGGNILDNAYQLKKYNIWFTSSTVVGEGIDRYWNAFGVNELKYNDNSIISEINIPFKGIDLRVGAMYVKNEKNDIFVLHTGKIGGGKKGIGKTTFIKKYKKYKRWINLKIKNKKVPVIKLGKIGDKKLLQNIEHMVHFLSQIKLKNKEDIKFNFEDRLRKYFDEYYGKYKYKRKKQSISVRCSHGMVVKKLCQVIKNKYKNILVMKSRKIDLAIVENNENKKIKAIFEIKTKISTTNLYVAVGQLLLNGLCEKKVPRKFIVLPVNIFSQEFRRLGIKLITFKKMSTIIFKGLPKII